MAETPAVRPQKSIVRVTTTDCAKTLLRTLDDTSMPSSGGHGSEVTGIVEGEPGIDRRVEVVARRASPRCRLGRYPARARADQGEDTPGHSAWRARRRDQDIAPVFGRAPATIAEL